MKKVILRAPILSASGYGVHSRQLARWLLSRPDVELSIIPVQWGITPWFINPDDKGGFIGKLMKHASAACKDADLSFQLQLPNEWDPKLATRNIGVTAGVETNICNPAWIESIMKMDHVVVPSDHIKQTFLRTAANMNVDISNKVSVIPECFVDDILRDDLPNIDLGLDTKFNFLLFGQLTGRSTVTDRKNTFNSIKWFCETFADDEDVGLIIKTNNGRESKIDRYITRDMLRQLLQSVRKGPFPRVHLLHGILDDSEIASLYRHPDIKALFSLTRGEGFGLPMLEAAASGLPVIATNWSAHLDFLNLGRFIKLDFDLKEVHKSKIDGQIFIKESKWAEVKENDVKRKLKKFKERSDMPAQWAAELKVKIREKFSFDAVKLVYDDKLKEFFE